MLQDPCELTTLIDEVPTAFLRESNIISASMHNFRYLVTVIEGGQRLSSPVPGRLVRLIPANGQYIAGHWIPGDVCHPPFPLSPSHLPPQLTYHTQ